MIASTADVRFNNCAQIKKVLRLMGGGTKAEVTRETGLSFATCSNLINQMVLSGEIVACRKEYHTDPGRPSERYALNPDFELILCIFLEKLEETPRIRYAIVNLFGQLRQEGAVDTAVLDAAFLEEAIAALLSREQRIRMLGISVQGVVSAEGNILSCDHRELAGIPMKAWLEERFKIPVICENDMNLLAFGAVRDETISDGANAAALAYYSCVSCGAGVVADGRILRGSTNFAGEISHLAKELPFREQLIFHLCSVIVMTNPSVVILVGDRISENLVSEAALILSQKLPQPHIPRLLQIQEPFPYARSGLIHRCLEGML